MPYNIKQYHSSLPNNTKQHHTIPYNAMQYLTQADNTGCIMNSSHYKSIKLPPIPLSPVLSATIEIWTHCRSLWSTTVQLYINCSLASISGFKYWNRVKVRINSKCGQCGTKCSWTKREEKASLINDDFTLLTLCDTKSVFVWQAHLVKTR